MGNSVPLDPPNRDPHASPEVDYTRYEPVQTPPVLPFGPRTEGESLERVVIRSNYNTDPDPAIEVARHIVPPKAAQVLAEQHGLFDTAFPTSFVNPDAYDTITKYPALDPPDGAVVQSEQGDFALSNEAVNDPADHSKTRYFPVDLVSLPYLPDPFARRTTAFRRRRAHRVRAQGAVRRGVGVARLPTRTARGPRTADV